MHRPRVRRCAEHGRERRPTPASGAPRGHHRPYRYYDLLLAGFVAVLLCSNLIGPGKAAALRIAGHTFTFGAGNVFFPISYVFGDVVTEVYGYARSRRAIWAGFGALAFAAVMSSVILHLPPAESEPHNRELQVALVQVFGLTWRVATASLVAYWCGDFVNSFVLAKMKILTRGRFLWTRTIGSTVAGQLVDSIVFYPMAFAGIWTGNTLLDVVVFNWIFKVAIEAVFTPVTYLVIDALKRAEGEDYYDVGTDFTPFSLKT
jgi:uncharacterized integral membrane protein (TIGR00697 family)